MVAPLGHTELFLFVLQLALLLLAARLAGVAARKVGLPAVVGELSGGIFLGPSVLGRLSPGLFATIFPQVQRQADLLAAVTWLGVIFLLLGAGLETDLALIRRKGRKVIVISIGGVFVPFAFGYLLSGFLPAAMVGAKGGGMVFSLFLATAMSISAVPVLARVLTELKLIRRDLGQLMLASGMLEDSIGWILLGVVSHLAVKGDINVYQPLLLLGSVTLVILFTFTVGRRLVAGVLRAVDDFLGGEPSLVSAIVLMALIGSALTLQLGLEAVLGAFAAGVLIRESPRYRPEITRGLAQTTRLVLAPIFFASAGLRVDLSAFGDPALLGWAGVALLVACLGKFIGVFLGSVAAGLGRMEGLALGAGLNARGAMEIIVAMVGFNLQVLSVQSYSVVILIAVATTLMTPPILKLVTSRIPFSPDERERLRHEDEERASLLGSVRKLLFPVRGGAGTKRAIEIVRELFRDRQTDVLVVAPREQRRFFRFGGQTPDRSDQAVAEALRSLMPMTAKSKVVTPGAGRSAVHALLREQRGHDLVVIGTGDPGDAEDEYTFGKFVDDFLQGLDVPALVVKAPAAAGAEPAPIESILVPVSGTPRSRFSIEIAKRLEAALGVRATLLFVDEGYGENGDVTEVTLAGGMRGAYPVAGQEELRVVRAASTARAVVEIARRERFGLVLLTAELRRGTNRAYLGEKAEQIIREVPCPVLTLVLRG